MKPILFSETSTVFTSNGIGRLSDALSCMVTEERNGQYELTMKYPVTGKHYSDIAIRSIIAVKPSASGSIQGFRVYKISKPTNGKVEVCAQHISYDLSKNVSMPFSISSSSSACAQTLAALKSNAVESCPFTFWTDVNTVSSYKQSAPASIRQRLGGVEGSVLDQFHGEYEWDNWTVKFHKNRGADNGVTLRYGKNITDITQEENISNTIVGVVPYWSDLEGTDTVVLPERAVYSQYADRYSQKLIATLDMSNDFKDKPTVSALRDAARAYINQEGIGIPKVSIDVSFVALWQTEEYKEIAPLQQVNLCDTVSIDFEPLGITNVTSKVVQTVYDVLAERYEKITLGSIRSNLATTINDQTTNAVASVSQKFGQVGNAINNATAWLTSADGYVIAVKDNDGTWKELIFADDKDPEDWVNVLRINENGIGFSSDGGQHYTQAWTLDGKLVIGGTDVPSITVQDSNGNIIFKADATAMVWNATNSSMDSTGKIVAKNATIKGIIETSPDSSTGHYVKIYEKGIEFIDSTEQVSDSYIKHNGNALNIYTQDYLTLGSSEEISFETYSIWIGCESLFIGHDAHSFKTGLTDDITITDQNGTDVTMEFTNGILTDVNYS